MEPRKKGWNLRGLTSLLTLAGFLIMAVTGLVLYVVPQGRIAYWTNWTFLRLTKTHWGDIHILSSILFVVAGTFHIYFNWKPLMNYLRDRIKGGVKLKKEIAISVAAMVLVTISGIYRLPPLSYLIVLNETIKEAWIVSKEYEPPFGHAELLSLRVFCSKTGLRFEAAQAELRRRGLKSVGADRTLEQIARANGISPLDIYRMINRLKKPEAQPGKEMSKQRHRAYTPQLVEETFAGTGLGNLSLADIGKKVGTDGGELLRRLQAKGIEGSLEESLKTLATRNGLAPLEVLKAALVTDHVPAKH
jgi:hypothetical protein